MLLVLNYFPQELCIRSEIGRTDGQAVHISKHSDEFKPLRCSNRLLFASGVQDDLEAGDRSIAPVREVAWLGFS